jgi:hypothetical protein
VVGLSARRSFRFGPDRRRAKVVLRLASSLSHA